MHGDTNMAIVTQCKYLGLLLTETLDYKVTTSMIAKSAIYALGLLFVKPKVNVCFHIDMTLFSPAYNRL